MARVAWSDGRWVASTHAERTGEVEASGPDPLSAMSNLVEAVVEELNDRDLTIESAG